MLVIRWLPAFLPRAHRGELSTAVAPARANLVLDPVELSMSGTLSKSPSTVRVRTVLPLPGRHSIENAAVALGMAILAGVAFEDESPR